MTEDFREEFRAALAPHKPIDDERRYIAELELGDDADRSRADNLVRRAQAGDAHAREQLIQRYMPLVARIARGFRVEGLDQVDLVQEGSLGLLRALARFDAARGVPFEAYALVDPREPAGAPQRLPAAAPPPAEGAPAAR